MAALESSREKAKVFGIGVFKTGTSTLGRALEVLGFRHSPEEWYRGLLVDDPWNSDPGRWHDYLELILDRARRYDGFQDYPWMFVFREMDQAFPGSRFIYTDRDPEKLVRSNQNHWRSRGALEESIPSREKILNRYYSHRQSVFDYFRNRNNLLIVNWEKASGWSELCNFLVEPVPAIPFPHVNRGIYPEFVS